MHLNNRILNFLMDCAEGNTLVPTWTYRGFFFQTCLLLLFRLILFNKFFPTYLFCRTRRNERTFWGAISGLQEGWLHWLLWHSDCCRATDHLIINQSSAMHPKLVRLYWPLEGAARTLREDGVSGLTRKIGKHLRKGEHE